MKKALLILLSLTVVLLTAACHTIEVELAFDTTAAATEAAAEEAPASEDFGSGVVDPAMQEAQGNVELQTVAPAQQVEQTTVETPATTLPAPETTTAAPAAEPTTEAPTTQVPNLRTGDMD